MRQKSARKADIEPPAGNRVEHRDLTRKLQRVVERRQHRTSHQACPHGALRRGSEEDDRVGAVAAVIVKVVLDDADMGETEAVGFLREVERLAEILLGRTILRPHIREKLHAELHR
jgi:hypothetical protein